MNINNIEVKFEDVDKMHLKTFFSANMHFIRNNSMKEYQNVKTFADKYEAYLKENDLKEHDVLMLFLAELRYEQLSLKVTDSYSSGYKRTINIPNMTEMTDLIKKWYNETKTNNFPRNNIYRR